jgi:hypothetical protein
MRKSFNAKSLNLRDPRLAMRVVIGVLLAANLVAAIIAFKPFGGSADDLRREQDELRNRLVQLRSGLKSSQVISTKVETARNSGDGFMSKYFLDSRTAALAVDQEIHKDAEEAKVKAGIQNYSWDPIEGSDTLMMLTISQGFEGPYENVTKLINLLDKSPRFIIIDSLQAAAPQGQNGKALTLNVTLKLKVFVRSQGMPPAQGAGAASAASSEEASQ